MADNKEWLPGTFWLADEPETKVHGRLYLSEDFRLELEGSLTSAMEEWTQTDDEGNVIAIGGALKSEEPGPFTLLGNLRGRNPKVSLFECMTVGRSGDLFMSADAAQTVRPIYGLRGDHIVDPSGLTGARVEIRHGTDWSRAPGFGMTVMNDGEHTMTYKDPAPETAALENGAVAQLVFLTKLQRPGPGGGSFKRRVAVEVDGFPPISYRDAERKYEVPLSSLVTLCLLRDSPPTRFFVRQRDGEWLEAISGSLASVEDGESDLKPWNIMLTLPDVGIAGVARWLNQVETLGSLPPVIAKAAGANSIQLETTLFDLTSVAEGLHSRLFEKMPGPVTKDTAKKIRGATEKHLKEAGFSDADVKVAIECLGGMTRPSYRERLAQMRGHAGDIVEEVFGSNFDLWSKAVADCRNDVAHRNLDSITPETSGLYAAVVYSLRWFLVTVLILETGISRETLRAKLLEKQAYQFFIQQAPDMLPEVYGDVVQGDEPAAEQP